MEGLDRDEDDLAEDAGLDTREDEVGASERINRGGSRGYQIGAEAKMTLCLGQVLKGNSLCVIKKDCNVLCVSEKVQRSSALL